MTPDPPASGTRLPSKAALRLAGPLALFFLLGCAGLVPVAWQAKRDHRVANAYFESEAEILEFIPIRPGNDTRSGKGDRALTRPSFVFRFTTKEGQVVTTRGYDAYGGREAPPSEWKGLDAGDRVPCWYDPADPGKAVLSRRFNPHFYWLLAWPLSIMGFTGLLLRECLRRAAPPTLKGVETGRRLAWRLPPVASQRALTGCLGVALVILAVLASGFVQAALDYGVVPHRFRWISHALGFNMNGWWIVALVTALLALLFLWAFLINLRWIAVPDPEVEVDAARLLPGQTTRLQVRQHGPIRAKSYTVSLVCEINGTPGKPPAIREILIERSNLHAGPPREMEAVEFSTEFTIPSSSRPSCHSVPVKSTASAAARDLVAWFIRVERQVSEKTILLSDFEILVGPETT